MKRGQINDALKARGDVAELVRCIDHDRPVGYYRDDVLCYAFKGLNWESEHVYVGWIDDYSVEQWLHIFDRLKRFPTPPKTFKRILPI